MDHPDHRLTQINILDAVDTRRAVSPRSTRKGDDLNKKGVGSRGTTAGTGKVQLSTVRLATSSPLQLRTEWGSPWTKYEKFYEVELSGPVEVAVQKTPPSRLVHIRAFRTQVASETLHLFRQLQHPAIVTALEAFTTDHGLYIVLKHMPISLEQIVRSPAYPDHRQLAAILGQLVTGVAYLANEGFEHGSLTCSNILLNTSGDVQIANQECCRVTLKGNLCDIRALSSITMELMQKYVKEDGAVGIDNLNRWPSNSDALEFLSATTSASSATELLKHPLLSPPWQKESLIGIISLAQVCIRGRYKYTPEKNF